MESLKINDLSYTYRDGEKIKEVLKDISYEFKPGKLYVVLGYSGSGKSTLISLLAGLDRPTSGTVELDGVDIEQIGLTKYRRNKSSVVFQDYKLIEYQTAHQNIMTSFRITDNKIPSDPINIAYNLLNFVGITQSKAIRKVGLLSGGEKQRVAIARALASSSDIILADEPTGNLDSETEGEIIKLLQVLVKEYNKCVVVVTHSDQVAKSSDVTIKLSDGIITV